MNKRMKVLALLLASVTVVTACGQTANTEQSESSKSAESSKAEASETQVEEEVPGLFNAEGFPIVNEEITIRILTQTNAQSQ